MAGIALAISGLSVGVSAIPYFIPIFDPKVETGMPDRIRLVQYKDENRTRIEAYAQPTLVNVGWNTQVEVIRAASLMVEPMEDGDVIEDDAKAMEFGWRNHGKFVAAPADNASLPCMAEEYSGDTALLVASPNEALAPAILLDPTTKPDRPYFKPGSYRMTLTLKRTINEDPLEEMFEVEITEDHIDAMNQCKSSATLISALPSARGG